MFALSLPLGMFAPALGHFVAGLVGGRIARTLPRALAGAVFTSLFWAVTVYMVSKTGIRTKSNVIYLDPMLALTPPLAIFAGAFTGARGRATKLAGLFMLMAAVTVTFKILQPYWAAAKQFQVDRVVEEGTQGQSCPENLKQLHKAVLLYADRWDDTLPPADRWTDLIKENVPEDRQLHCPSINGKDNYGYAMNTALGGKRWKDMKDASHTPLFYDSTDFKPNAHDDYKSLPSPGRHDNHNNVLFLDGHIGQR